MDARVSPERVRAREIAQRIRRESLDQVAASLTEEYRTVGEIAKSCGIPIGRTTISLIQLWQTGRAQILVRQNPNRARMQATYRKKLPNAG